MRASVTIRPEQTGARASGSSKSARSEWLIAGGSRSRSRSRTPGDDVSSTLVIGGICMTMLAGLHARVIAQKVDKVHSTMVTLQ